MITDETLSFIKERLKNGATVEKIKADLVASGLPDSEVVAAIRNAVSFIATQSHAEPPKKTSFLKTLFLLILLIALGVGGAYGYKMYQETFIEGRTDRDTEAEASDVTEDLEVKNDEKLQEKIAPEVKPVQEVAKPVASVTVSVDLWSLFEKAQLALKNKDVKAYNAVSYEQVRPEEESAFLEFTAYMYEVGAKISKTSIIAESRDAKQSVMFARPVKIDSVSAYGYEQSKISFINKNGTWKVQGVGPQSWSVLKSGTDKTAAQVETDLQVMMKDSDLDGETDETESCTRFNGSHKVENCTKTDPNKKDTDGDGWWDGNNPDDPF